MRDDPRGQYTHLPSPAEMHAALLRGCVERWAADVLRSCAAGAPDAATLVYVHGFLGGATPDEDGSRAAVEALRALDAACGAWQVAGRALRVCSLLLEEDPTLIERTAAALGEAGFGGRLHAGGGLDTLPPGAIALREGEPAHALGEWTAGAGPTTYAFVALAPPRPDPLPLPLVRELAERERTEVLVRLPTAGLGAQIPPLLPLADLPPYVRRTTGGYAAMLGIPAASWLAEWRAAGSGVPEALVHRYAERVQESASGRTARRISLSHPPPSSGRGDWLLVTEDPARALATNRLPQGPGWEQVAAWAGWRLVHAVRPAAEPLDLFGERAPAPGGTRRQVDVEALTDALGGRALPEREALALLAESDLLPEEVRRTLRMLRGGVRRVSRTPEELPLFASGEPEPD